MIDKSKNIIYSSSSVEMVFLLYDFLMVNMSHSSIDSGALTSVSPRRHWSPTQPETSGGTVSTLECRNCPLTSAQFTGKMDNDDLVV